MNYAQKEAGGEDSGLTGSGLISHVEYSFKKAEEAGANVDDLRAELDKIRGPILRKRAEKRLSFAAKKIAEGRDSGLPVSKLINVEIVSAVLLSGFELISHAERSFEEAEEAGVNVDDLRAELDKIRGPILRKGAEGQLNYIQKVAKGKSLAIVDASWHIANYVEQSFKEAEDAGVDVDDLRDELDKIKDAILRKKAS